MPATPGEEDLQATDVVDLTARLDPTGTLTWDAPAGDWQVLRIGCTLNDHCRVSTCSGGWEGYALDPFDAHAWLILGNARSKAGDPDGAMKAWERAATFDGMLFPAFKNLAAVYEQLGFSRRATMAWSRAHDLAPDLDTRRRIHERLSRRPP